MINIIIIGIFLAIIANFVQNTGVNLQKYSHTKNGGDIYYKYVKNPIWLIGIIFNVLGALCELSSLAFAPQSIIAPIGSLSIIINMTYSKYLHNDVINKKMIISTIIILFGNVISIICAPKVEYVHSGEDIYNLFNDVKFILYIVIFTLIVGFLNIYLSYYNTPRRERLIYPMLSGIAGGMNALFAKSLSKLVYFYIEQNDVSTKESSQNIRYIATCLFIIAVILCSLLHIRWLNRGLAKYSILYIYPLNKSIWIISSIFGGIIVFEEYKDFDDKPVKATFFVFGVIIMILGITRISSDKIIIHKNEEVIEQEDVGQEDVGQEDVGQEDVEVNSKRI